MKSFVAAGVCLVWMLGGAGLAAAHRVNIFAYVDGDIIRVECGFSRGQKVRQGAIEVFDSVTDGCLVRGATDDAGIFVFPVPPEARAAGHDLRVVINAGQGHKNEWVVSAQEMGSRPAPSPAAPPATSATGNAPASPSGRGAAADSAPAAPSDILRGMAESTMGSTTGSMAGGLTRADVAAVVNEALDVKLAPIKHMLAGSVEAGPDMKDIIGGIGWIFGLVGVAAWFRRRG